MRGSRLFKEIGLHGQCHAENRKIIEWLSLEVTSQPMLPNPCHEQGCPPPAQAAQGPIQPGLERLQGYTSSPFPNLHRSISQSCWTKLGTPAIC